jgi:hypothetical protein
MDIIGRVRARMKERGVRPAAMLARQQIAAFEARWNVSLPDDHRRFLCEVGDGTVAGDTELSILPLQVACPLDEPFPLTEALFPEDIRDDELAPTDVERISRGWLPLMKLPDGSRFVLIVSGTAYGEVWNVSSMGARPVNGRPGFLRWYESWLEGPPEIWWDEDEDVQPTPLLPDSGRQQDILLFATSLARRDPGRARAELARITDPNLTAWVEFIQAMVASTEGAPDAAEQATAVARKWLGPAAEGALNQYLQRTEVLALLDRVDGEDVEAMKEAVRTAPEPEVWIPEGNFF